MDPILEGIYDLTVYVSERRKFGVVQEEISNWIFQTPGGAARAVPEVWISKLLAGIKSFARLITCARLIGVPI